MSHPFNRTGVLYALAFLLAGPAAQAATVRFNVVPASNRNAQIRTIRTGSRIKYFITVDVISDSGQTDNSGLALFNVNIETDLGIAQPSASAFVPVVRDNFRLFPSLGNSSDDDIIAIGAAQSTFGGNVVIGLGQRQTQDLVEGFFQTPDSEGSFAVSIDLSGSTANVLSVDFQTSGGASAAREIIAGPGFTIITADDAEEDPGDDLNIFGDLPGAVRLGIAGLGIGVVAVTVIIGLFIAGPWGAALALFIGAVLGLITLFAGSMMASGGA